MMSEEQIEKTAEGEPGDSPAAEREESFADLLEKSEAMSVRLEPGKKVKTRVIGFSGDHVYVDLGGKSDGIIDIAEFLDENGQRKVKEGDEIEAYFLSVQNGTRVLTTKVHGYPAQKLSSIREAFQAGLPINGDVKREVKGGFEISVAGVRCFCPFSQIDLKGGREGGIFLGRTFAFKVIEFEEDGRNVILSRRAILEQERQEKRSRLKDSLTAGSEITGTVRSIQNFGAFVDLGGIDALIPASEVSWDRGVRISDVLSIGAKVTARIISLDWEGNRITLSLKALQPDPWSSLAQKYAVDSKITGTIVRLAPFGAFVNLEAGVDGLVHISNLGAGRRVNHPKEVVEVGQVVEAYVLEIDTQNRKISLSLQPKVKKERVPLPAAGEVFEGVVEKAMPYGVFVKIGNGLTGLVPNAEMGTAPGSDHSRMFPQGSAMKVVVIDVDTEQGKVRLSRKDVTARLEQEQFEQFKHAEKNRQEATSSGFGSLGELLKAKMEEKKREEG